MNKYTPEVGDVWEVSGAGGTTSEWGMGKEREITKKRKFSVYLNATADVSATITVKAETKEEAKDLAIDKVSNCDWDVDDVATSSIEVLYVCEEEDED